MFWSLLLGAASLFEAGNPALDPASSASLSTQEQWDLFLPQWVVNKSDRQEESVLLNEGDKVELFQFHPKEAFRMSADVVEPGSGDVLIPAGRILVRAPGPLAAACEMTRQPGFERRTCMVDDDLDGRFESYFRRLDTSIVTMVAAQSPLYKKLTRRSLGSPIAFTALDEAADIPPFRMFLTYNRTPRKAEGKSSNLLRVCIGDYEDGQPQGKEYFGRNCLAPSFVFLDNQLPYRIVQKQFTIIAEAQEGNGISVRIKRNFDERLLTLKYSLN